MLNGEKGHHSVDSGARHQFIIELVIDLNDSTVQKDISKGHCFIALAPLHQYVLDALGLEEGRGPVFSYEVIDAVILHSQLAAAVIDTLLSMQKAMSATRLRSCCSAHIPSSISQPEQMDREKANIKGMFIPFLFALC